MTCEMFRDRVFDYLQGTLRDAAAFEAHRGSCPDCAGRLAGIRENDRILSAARVPSAPADLWPRIALAIGQDRVVPFRRLQIASFAAAAAVLVVALFLGSMGSSRRAPSLKLVVQEVGPESHRAFRTLVPRYEDVDAATAMVDTMFRNDY